MSAANTNPESTTAPPNATVPRGTPWIGGRGFDLAIFFGTALLALLAPTLAVTGVVPPLVIVWAYVLFFDGPHMMAGYSRTFLDKETRQKRRGLLYGTTAAAVVFPIGAALMSAGLRNDWPFQLFLGLMTLYSFWHIVRQGWGIFALYRSREGERANVRVERTLFYVAMYAPYIYFLFVHPAVRAVMLGDGHSVVAVADVGGVAPLRAAWEGWASRGLVTIGVVALLFFVVRIWRARAMTALYYGTTTIVFHAIVYFVFSVREPIFAGARGTDQTFMVITAAVSVCHSTQYIALVFIHNARRYASGASVHGLAAKVSAKALPYLATCLGFAVLYVGLTWLTGIYPGFDMASAVQAAPAQPGLSGANATGFSGLSDAARLTLPRLALAIYWGIALQHYLLDARIWRIKTDPELRRVFMKASV